MKRELPTQGVGILTCCAQFVVIFGWLSAVGTGPGCDAELQCSSELYPS